MKFVNVRLLTNDFSATLKFWRDILGLSMTYSDESLGYAYFDTGNGGVELLSREGFTQALGEVTPTPAGREAVLVFRVDDVDTIYTELVARGATAVHGPIDRPAWQARSAHISDPDGHLVEIYSQLGTFDTPTA